MFNHEVVPDYLRTKPEPEVEEKSQQLTTKANQITQDLAQVKLNPCPTEPGLFSCSTRLSVKFILLINVKMPTIVGILTFISMINTTSERLKARNFFICRYFSFYEQLNCWHFNIY